MTKFDIVRNVNEQLGFSKKDSAAIVESVFEIIKDNLARGEKIKISGFGNFVVKKKNARRGRNPQTGDEIEITSRKVLNFKASQVLRRALNE
ncbi:MAG: integration host factor subunit alpha [Syntrophales bacterium]|nr:integration host factor subunit alpha [Syntrophales bacterium]